MTAGVIFHVVRMVFLPPYFNFALVILLFHYLFSSMSISSNFFPKIWKESLIIPFYKGGPRGDITNYHPIAKLSSIPKLFEAIVTKTIIFNIKTIICREQHGFMNGRSTTSNLLEFVTFCTDQFIDRCQVDCIFTDFSKAFDKLSHGILLLKLASIGFNENFVSWIGSYLKSRTCRINFNGCVSDVFKIGSGIPQGSHLGPVMFILFINDLIDSIKHSKCLMYADDVKLFKSIVSAADCHELQSDISNFYLWCKTNGLTLNINKCKVMNFTRRNTTMTYSYHLDGMVLSSSCLVKDLGVFLDTTYFLQSY